MKASPRKPVSRIVSKRAAQKPRTLCQAVKRNPSSPKKSSRGASTKSVAKNPTGGWSTVAKFGGGAALGLLASEVVGAYLVKRSVETNQPLTSMGALAAPLGVAAVGLGMSYWLETNKRGSQDAVDVLAGVGAGGILTVAGAIMTSLIVPALVPASPPSAAQTSMVLQLPSAQSYRRLLEEAFQPQAVLQGLWERVFHRRPGSV